MSELTSEVDIESHDSGAPLNPVEPRHRALFVISMKATACCLLIICMSLGFVSGMIFITVIEETRERTLCASGNMSACTNIHIERMHSTARACLYPAVPDTYYGITARQTTVLASAGRCQRKNRPEFCSMFWATVTPQVLRSAELLTAQALRCMIGARVPLDDGAVEALAGELEHRLYKRLATTPLTTAQGVALEMQARDVFGLLMLAFDSDTLSSAPIFVRSQQLGAALQYRLGHRWLVEVTDDGSTFTFHLV